VLFVSFVVRILDRFRKRPCATDKIPCSRAATIDTLVNKST
jgi:hypothetical protein